MKQTARKSITWTPCGISKEKKSFWFNLKQRNSYTDTPVDNCLLVFTGRISIFYYEFVTTRKWTRGLEICLESCVFIWQNISLKPVTPKRIINGLMGFLSFFNFSPESRVPSPESRVEVPSPEVWETLTPLLHYLNVIKHLMDRFSIRLLVETN